MTGPGDYKEIKLTGGPLSVSNKKNAPSFSFGTKVKKPPIISKKHVQELVGQDTPGVGSYNTKAEEQHSPKFSIGSEQRFQEKTAILTLKKQV